MKFASSLVQNSFDRYRQCTKILQGMDLRDCKSDRLQQKKENYAVLTTRDVPEVDKESWNCRKDDYVSSNVYENVGESVRKNPFSNADLEMKLIKYCQEEEKSE